MTIIPGLEAALSNYLTEWAETHYEVIERIQENPHPVIRQQEHRFGRGGMWMLAQEITQAFMDGYADHEWDGEWFDTLDAFVSNHLNSLSSPEVSPPSRQDNP